MEKLATLIINSFTLLAKKLDNLIMEVKKQKVEVSLKDVKMPHINMPDIVFPKQEVPVVNVPAPIVHVQAPVVNVPETQITVTPAPVTFPEKMVIVDMDKLLEALSREVEQKGLLDGISNTNPIPMMIVDKKGKQITQFASDITIPTNFELRIGANKVSTTHPLPVTTDGFAIPVFDTEVINEADPNNVIITYKKSGVTVATKTIVISGTTTTITVV